MLLEVMGVALGTLKVAVTEGTLASLLLLSLAIVAESLLLLDVMLLLSLGVVIVYETLILLLLSSSGADTVSPPLPPPPPPPPPTSPRWDLIEALVDRELEGGALMVKLADTCCCSAEVLVLLDDEGTWLLTSEALASTDGTRSLTRVEDDDVDVVVGVDAVAVVDDGSLC